MSAFFKLIGGIKGIAVILLIIAVGAWAFTQKRNVEKAELAKNQAIAQRDQVAVERDKAIIAARVNEQTVEFLKDQVRDANLALNKLAEQKEINRANTVTREVIIQNQATVPANAAQSAPVLGAIISEVQNDRVRRRAQ